MGLLSQALINHGRAISKLLAAGLLLASLAFAQTTGKISGTVTDEHNAAVSGAQVTITDNATGRATGVRTNAAGVYTSGDLAASEYIVKVEARGLRSARATVTVQERAISTADFKLAAPTVIVNVEQPGIERTVGSAELEALPVNGRIFLNADEGLPGFQPLDAASINLARAGYSSASLEASLGTALRFDLDHVDITDEITGGPLLNIPLSAIEEFRVRPALPDLSWPLSAAGTLNVVTKAGTDALHGEAFYNFRDQAADASLPGGARDYFQRNQFGGSAGGALVPGKVFFFASAERNKQDAAAPVLSQAPFENLAGTLASPFRENQFTGRLDLDLSDNARAFYRVLYNRNRGTMAPLPTSFQAVTTNNYAQSHVAGLDFASGDFVHTFRFGYTRLHNLLGDAGNGPGLVNPVPGIEIGIGADPFCLTPGVDSFCSGINYLTQQNTYQTSTEFKYDGSKASGAHDFRFGAGYNRIHAAVLAAFLGSGPAVGASIADCAQFSFCIPSDPATYPVMNAVLGNGQAAFGNQSAFGLNGAGLPVDNRLTAYAGDIWKVKQNLVVRYGASYVRDSGRTDSDLPAISALDQFGPGLGSRVRQPNANFAPQLGIAWDPGKSSKSVIRMGVGVFYANPVWESTIFDRAGRLAQGQLQAVQPICSGGITQLGGIPFPDGSIVTPTFCGQPVGSVAPQIIALQQQYRAAAQAAGANPAFAGTVLADGLNATGTSLLFPDYSTPRSVQMNLGLQHELHEGLVFSIDYLRNVGTHTLQSMDTNHVGAARYLDRNAALTAISATTTAFGCGGGTASLDIDCAIASGATLRNFAANGIDSANNFCFGLPCSTFGTRAAAFPGVNSSLGTNQMLFPMGRSVYNGVQLSVREESHGSLRGVRSMRTEFSYSYSKNVSTSRSSGLLAFATDNDDPLKFIGPNDLDRRHQLSFAAAMDVPKNFRISFVGRFYSPLPQTLTLESPGVGAIFVSDVTGDGTDGSLVSTGGIGDVLPGTNLGAFGRRNKAAGVNTSINYYNTNFAGRATPAGQALINAGLFNLSELQAIGAVMPEVALAPSDQAGISWLKDFDVSVGWVHKISERIELTPTVSFYNVFNIANFNSPSNILSGVLTGTSGSANGTPGRQPAGNRIGLGSGVFSLGAPRMAEFTLKLTF
jgi:Carboxypeptidase regulatory-like domain